MLLEELIKRFEDSSNQIEPINQALIPWLQAEPVEVTTNLWDSVKQITSEVSNSIAVNMNALFANGASQALPKGSQDKIYALCNLEALEQIYQVQNKPLNGECTLVQAERWWVLMKCLHNHARTLLKQTDEFELYDQVKDYRKFYKQFKAFDNDILTDKKLDVERLLTIQHSLRAVHAMPFIHAHATEKLGTAILANLNKKGDTRRTKIAHQLEDALEALAHRIQKEIQQETRILALLSPSDNQTKQNGIDTSKAIALN